MKTKTYAKETKQKALAMRNAGKSTKEIAKAIGCSENTIRYWITTKAILPTIEVTTKRKKPLKLIPISYACPHCGGEIERP